MKNFIKLGLIVVLSVSLTSAAFAQQQEAQTKKSGGPRRQLATIVFAGLGGAILGLSTLSFYGRPQEQLVNIAVGFAVGIIAGTTYVTFKSATTKEYYDEEERDKRGEVEKPRKVAVSPFVTQSSEEKPNGGGANLVFSF